MASVDIPNGQCAAIYPTLFSIHPAQIFSPALSVDRFFLIQVLRLFGGKLRFCFLKLRHV